jgi:hypothetical protein
MFLANLKAGTFRNVWPVLQCFLIYIRMVRLLRRADILQQSEKNYFVDSFFSRAVGKSAYFAKKL